MKISISNIAWETKEDNEIAAILKQYNVRHIDIAPPKYFSADMNPSLEELHKVRSFWEKQGVQMYGMQALLFGTTGLNVFSTDNVQQDLLDHLKKVCRIARELGITKLVFGSPKSRDRGELSDEKVAEISRSFFSRLGDIAVQNNVIICLEPNPPIYACNFMTTTMEAASVVRDINHPGIKLQLDTGTIIANNENFQNEFASYKDLIGHYHVSEPHLKPVGEFPAEHKAILAGLKTFANDEVITIEMVTSKDRKDLKEIENSIKFVCELYQ